MKDALPYIVGITGGIGSGKSYVCHLIAQANYPVYTSDLEARQIIDTHPDVMNQIKQLFGEDIYTSQGLDRKRVSHLVFSQPDFLQAMNHIVHPAVYNHFLEWAKSQSASMVFLESAILVSSGFDALCNAIVHVTAPQVLRIKRVVERDKVSEEEVLRRMANQSEEHSKLSIPALTLLNDETQPIEQRVADLLHKLSTVLSTKI